MRTILTASLLALAGALPVTAAPAAEDQLEVRVIDGVTGRPVPRAEVSILGYPGERVTDADGHAVWQPAPAPPFELLIVLPGGRYARPVLVERLPQRGALDIRVETLDSESIRRASQVSGGRPAMLPRWRAADQLLPTGTATDRWAGAGARRGEAFGNHKAVKAVRSAAPGRYSF